MGDITRTIGPRTSNKEITAYFASLNGGKKSIELDLSAPDGAAAFERLVASADVLVENYKAGSMEKWGLGYDHLVEVNPNLIYGSISGFLDGPYWDLPAFDMVVQALSGSMSITGEADGPPMRPGIPIDDICAGMYAVIGILAALPVRDQYGGQYVKAPMFSGLVSWLTERTGWTFATKEPYPQDGTAHPSLAPYRMIETANGWFTIAIGSEGSWARFCDAIDRPNLQHDPRFKTNSDRLDHCEELVKEIESVMNTQTSAHWFSQFRESGVPGAPVKNTVEVFQDDHLQQAPYTLNQTADGTDMTFVTIPLAFSGFETEMNRIPPKLGEHTEKVLSELLSQNDLQSIL